MTRLIGSSIAKSSLWSLTHLCQFDILLASAQPDNFEEEYAFDGAERKRLRALQEAQRHRGLAAAVRAGAGDRAGSKGRLRSGGRRPRRRQAQPRALHGACLGQRPDHQHGPAARRLRHGRYQDKTVGCAISPAAMDHLEGKRVCEGRSTSRSVYAAARCD
jgi:hypothetical protein